MEDFLTLYISIQKVKINEILRNTNTDNMLHWALYLPKCVHAFTKGVMGKCGTGLKVVQV